MTTSNNRIPFIILVIALIVLGLLYRTKNLQFLSTETPGTVSTTTLESSSTHQGTTDKPVTIKPTTLPVSTKGYNSYASGEYNFTIQYPKNVTVRNSFFSFHELGNNWRLYPNPINQGKQVVSFSIFTTDQGPYSTGNQTYPLFFSAEVRIGVSPNTKECYTTDAGYTSQTVTTVTSNGITFKRFSTSDAATMKYVQAESYRTIHNNMCYVLEQIKNGSIYRDEKMKMGTTDEMLNKYYSEGETIIKTFKFTK